MSPRTARPVALRTVAVASLSTVALVVLAGPATAHTTIELDNPQAGAANVTLRMTAEAESDTAGIVSVQVVLPEGIPPTQVTPATTPPGWALVPTADGFTVSGTALGVHTDAKLAVRIAQLPTTAPVLVFKTLVTYGNGSVDRWIEPPTAQNPDPEHPAPTVPLRGAAAPSAPPAPSVSPTDPGPGGASGRSATLPPAGAGATAAGSGGSAGWTGWLIAAAVVATLAAAAGGWLRRRRSAVSAPAGR